MYQRSTREMPEAAVPTAAVGAIALRRVKPLNFGVVVLLSMLLHALLIGGTALIMLILQFLGFDISLFDPLVMKERDIEFVLVENPEQQPRNPTKNRSDRATRAGGEKIPNEKQAEPQRKAGQPNQAQPQPRPQPQQAAQKPQPKPAPRPQPQQQPSPQPSPPKQVTQAPPQPKLPTPTRTPAKTPSLPPNPIAPAIKTPAPPTPKVAHAGPVMSSSSSSSGSGTSGRPSPSQISGSPSTGSSMASASPGSSSASAGSGGSSSYNQSGSPGGGGGRPGIDALPEPDYGAYMAELQRRIKRNWRPPSAQEDKRVVVLFRIARDGRLLSLDVNNSSGYPEADQAAMAAVKLSAPFRPLPAGHRDNDLAVQFTFDYNVYKNRGGGITSYR